MNSGESAETKACARVFTSAASGIGAVNSNSSIEQAGLPVSMRRASSASSMWPAPGNKTVPAMWWSPRYGSAARDALTSNRFGLPSATPNTIG